MSKRTMQPTGAHVLDDLLVGGKAYSKPVLSSSSDSDASAERRAARRQVPLSSSKRRPKSTTGSRAMSAREAASESRVKKKKSGNKSSRIKSARPRTGYASSRPGTARKDTAPTITAASVLSQEDLTRLRHSSYDPSTSSDNEGVLLARGVSPSPPRSRSQAALGHPEPKLAPHTDAQRKMNMNRSSPAVRGALGRGGERGEQQHKVPLAVGKQGDSTTHSTTSTSKKRPTSSKSSVPFSAPRRRPQTASPFLTTKLKPRAIVFDEQENLQYDPSSGIDMSGFGDMGIQITIDDGDHYNGNDDGNDNPTNVTGSRGSIAATSVPRTRGASHAGIGGVSDSRLPDMFRERPATTLSGSRRSTPQRGSNGVGNGNTMGRISAVKSRTAVKWGLNSAEVDRFAQSSSEWQAQLTAAKRSALRHPDGPSLAVASRILGSFLASCVSDELEVVCDAFDVILDGLFSKDPNLNGHGVSVNTPGSGQGVKAVHGLLNLANRVPYCESARVAEERIRPLETQLRTYLKEAGSLQTDMMQVTVALKDMQEQGQAKDRKIADLELELANEKKLHHRLQTECNYNNEEIDSLKSLIATLRNTEDRLETRIATLEVEKEGIFQKSESFKSGLAQALKDLGDYQHGTRDVSRALYSQCVQERDDARQEVQDLQEKLHGTELKLKEYIGEARKGKNQRAALTFRPVFDDELLAERLGILPSQEQLEKKGLSKARAIRPPTNTIVKEMQTRLEKFDIQLKSAHSELELTTTLLEECVLYLGLEDPRDAAERRQEMKALVSKAQSAEPFPPRGTSSEVPRWLRSAQPVRNRQMGKGELEDIIKDVWHRKENYETQKGVEIKLVDYMYLYLKGKYGIEASIIEAGYNIWDACERSVYDADCAMFLEILQGKVSEALYKGQLKMVEELETATRESKHANKGKISKRSFAQLLSKMYPAKPSANLDKLKTIIHTEQPESRLDIDMLFAEDDDGNEGPFVEELRLQYLQEAKEYEVEIVAMLEKFVHPVAGVPSVSVDQVLTAFRKVDGGKSAADVTSLLQYAFSITKTEDLQPDVTRPLATVIQRLKASTLFRRSTAKGNQRAARLQKARTTYPDPVKFSARRQEVNDQLEQYKQAYPEKDAQGEQRLKDAAAAIAEIEAAEQAERDKAEAIRQKEAERQQAAKERALLRAQSDIVASLDNPDDDDNDDDNDDDGYTGASKGKKKKGKAKGKGKGMARKKAGGVGRSGAPKGLAKFGRKDTETRLQDGIASLKATTPAKHSTTTTTTTSTTTTSNGGAAARRQTASGLSQSKSDSISAKSGSKSSVHAVPSLDLRLAVMNADSDDSYSYDEEDDDGLYDRDGDNDHYRGVSAGGMAGFDDSDSEGIVARVSAKKDNTFLTNFVSGGQ